VTELSRGWLLDDALAAAHLGHVAAAFDRLRLLDAALGGSHGLLAALAAGRRSTSAKAVEVLLKAERQAAETFEAAIAALDLAEQAPAKPSSLRRVS
jgi:hypothetical protein